MRLAYDAATGARRRSPRCGIADTATGATVVSIAATMRPACERGGVRHVAGSLAQPLARLLCLVIRSRSAGSLAQPFARLRWLVIRSRWRGAKSISGESDVSRDSSYSVHLLDMPIVPTL